MHNTREQCLTCCITCYVPCWSIRPVRAQATYVTEGQFCASHSHVVPEDEVELDERAKAHLPQPGAALIK